MCGKNSILATNEAYRVAHELLDEAINELQSHDDPRFDVLHELVAKANTLLESMSPSDVEELAKAPVIGCKIILVKLFSEENSIEETLQQLLAERDSLNYNCGVFAFDTDESNWYTDVKGCTHFIGGSSPSAKKETSITLPEIEQHSFLN